MKCRSYSSNSSAKSSKMISCRSKLNSFIRSCPPTSSTDSLVSIGLLGVCCTWKHPAIRFASGRTSSHNEGVTGGVDDNDDEDDEEDADNGVGDVDEDGIMNEVGNDVDCSIGMSASTTGVPHWFSTFTVPFSKQSIIIGLGLSKDLVMTFPFERFETVDSILARACLKIGMASISS